MAEMRGFSHAYIYSEVMCSTFLIGQSQVAGKEIIWQDDAHYEAIGCTEVQLPAQPSVGLTFA